MRLLIIGWRPWSVAIRYRSLMLNAKRLGHQLLGIASQKLGDQDLTLEAFRELSVPAIKGSGEFLTSEMAKFDPDATFGEQYWDCKEEVMARNWMAKRNRQSLMLDHWQYWEGAVRFLRILGHRNTLLVVNDRVAQVARRQTKAKIVVVGQPDLDLMNGVRKPKDIRERLGVKDGQRLVALFLKTSPAGSSQENMKRFWGDETENMQRLMDVADHYGWQIVAHGHARIRVTKHSFWHRWHVPHYKMLQDRGVKFITGFVPAVADGIDFQACFPLELMSAADAVTGSAFTPAYPAYAMGKRFFRLGVDLQSNPPEGLRTFQQAHLLPNIVAVDDDFSELIRAVEDGLGGFEQNDEFTKEWFYKLDGKCWQRMLALVEGRDDEDR